MKPKDWISKVILSFVLVAVIVLATTSVAVAQETVILSGTVNILNEAGIRYDNAEIEGVRINVYIANDSIDYTIVGKDGRYNLRWTYEETYRGKTINFLINTIPAEQSANYTSGSQTVNLTFPPMTVADIEIAKFAGPVSPPLEWEEVPTVPGASSLLQKLTEGTLLIIIYIIAGTIVILVLIYFLFFKGRYTLPDYGRAQKKQNELLESRLKNAQNELQQVKAELSQSRAQQAKAQELGRHFSLIADSIRRLSTSLNEPISKKFSDEPIPSEDYGNLAKPLSTLGIINSYLQEEGQRRPVLVNECRDLITNIKRSGVDTSVYEKCIAESNTGGLEVLRAILEPVSKSVEVRKANPEIMQELEAYKEKINRIRDYTYRVPPVALLGFAEEMVQETAPGEEMVLREKTVKEIMNIIDRYLKL